jgi:hypothetical protein
MIIAMIAPQTRPQPPYLIFPAFSGFIDNTSLNYVVIFLPVMTYRRYEFNEVIAPGRFLSAETQRVGKRPKYIGKTMSK